MFSLLKFYNDSHIIPAPIRKQKRSDIITLKLITFKFKFVKNSKMREIWL